MKDRGFVRSTERENISRMPRLTDDTTLHSDRTFPTATQVHFPSPSRTTTQDDTLSDDENFPFVLPRTALDWLVLVLFPLLYEIEQIASVRELARTLNEDNNPFANPKRIILANARARNRSRFLPSFLPSFLTPRLSEITLCRRGCFSIRRGSAT